MTQQPWDTETPPTPTVYSQPVRVVAVTLLAIFVVGIGNVVYSARHQPKPMPASAWVLQQQRESINAQLARLSPAPPQTQASDPDDFDETRDGSNSLSLEDENGKASVWEDKKSGSRIFCLDSCTVLPAAKPPNAFSPGTLLKKGR